MMLRSFWDCDASRLGLPFWADVERVRRFSGAKLGEIERLTDGGCQVVVIGGGASLL